MNNARNYIFKRVSPNFKITRHLTSKTSFFKNPNPKQFSHRSTASNLPSNSSTHPSSLVATLLAPRFTSSQASATSKVFSRIRLAHPAGGTPGLPQVLNTCNASDTSVTRTIHAEDGLFARTIKKYNIFNYANTRLKVSGYLLYESVADHIDYEKFFEDVKMTNSFLSWFLITELHVWMLMVRTMAEEEAIGRKLRNSMVEAMWQDVETRARVLLSGNSSSLRKSLITLSEEFNAAMIGYDEGVNGNDKVLAGAIWRRIFQSEGSNPETLERLLVYIRKQIVFLENIPTEELLKASIPWLPFDEV